MCENESDNCFWRFCLSLLSHAVLPAAHKKNVPRTYTYTFRPSLTLSCARTYACLEKNVYDHARRGAGARTRGGARALRRLLPPRRRAPGLRAGAWGIFFAFIFHHLPSPFSPPLVCVNMFTLLEGDPATAIELQATELLPPLSDSSQDDLVNFKGERAATSPIVSRTDL